MDSLFDLCALPISSISEQYNFPCQSPITQVSCKEPQPLIVCMGYDIDKNVITRIETQQRYVTDIELQALCQLFNISFEDFVSNKKKN